jgi:MscS family membrane protein
MAMYLKGESDMKTQSRLQRTLQALFITLYRNMNLPIDLSSVLVAMLLLLFNNIVWAQNPLEPADTSSPWATLKSFLAITDATGKSYNKYRESPGPVTYKEVRQQMVKAVSLLDLSDVPPAVSHEVGSETVILLWEVIARQELKDLDKVPGAPKETAADTDVTLPSRWRIPHTSIVIAQVTEGPRTGEYLFSPGTVEKVSDYYELIKSLPYQRPMPSRNLLHSIQQITGWMIPVMWVESLPDWSKVLVFDQAIWKWVVELLLTVLAAVLFLVLYKVARIRPWDGSYRSYLPRISTPLALIFLMYLLDVFILEHVISSGLARSLYSYLTEITLNIGIVWLIWLTLKWAAEAVITASPQISEGSLDAHLLRLAERTIGILLITGFILHFLHNIGIPIYGLVAGAGVGGIAVALAFQSSLENFVGTLNIFADRPVRVGDFCRYGDESPGLSRVGTVEEIGMRSTRIRGPDRTITTIPNAEFAKMHIVNLSKRNQMVLKINIGLRYETTTDQLLVVLARLREMLLAHPCITEEPARVRATALGEYAINLELMGYVDTEDWNEYLSVQEDVILRVMEIVADAGTAFAFPSRTLYYARDTGMDANKQQAASEQVAEWIASQSLPFPNFPEDYRKQVKDTIKYPPEGSPDMNKS